MKKEFILAFNEVIEDRQLPREVVMEALEAAMVSAYRKAVNASNAQLIVARVDPETGKVEISAEKEVVDIVNDDRTEVALDVALVIDPEAELGGLVVVESTPKNFGRVAAQTARQVIQQRIREAERETQSEYFSGLTDEIVNGVVQATSSQAITLGLDKRAEGIMPRNQQIPGERFRVHDRVRALLLEVKATPRGPQIILSRAHRNFLRRLLEDEVPEIYHGLVEIRSIAREPGHRSKVAVAALQAGIDPVGACVGMRGVRIQAIVRELNDEKIDVIEWNSDPAMYIAKALSPARVTGVYLDKMAKGTKTATVVVPEDQLSLAIGRDGQNARLAAKLTGWRIDIKSLPEATSDALYKLQNDPTYAEEAVIEVEAGLTPQIEVILTKKSEGRPVTPEEYKLLSQFVERVEQGNILRQQADRIAEKERQEAARAVIPAPAFDLTLEDIELSSRWITLLSEAGFSIVGNLMYQMNLDPDVILALNGVGPKAMTEIQAKLDALDFPAEIEEIEEVEVGEADAEALAAAADIVDGETVKTEVEAAIEEGVEAAAPEAVGETVEEAPVEAELEVVEEVVEVEVAPPVVEKPKTPKRPAKPEKTIVFVEDAELEKLDKKDKKKKKQVFREVEYDPDQDVTIVKRRRKRDLEDWEKDEWDL